jgi:N-acetylneuraminate synthase/N,N'-diacetyllegionaminate synthase
MDSIKIENKEIGNDKPVYVVAEAGLNHNGDIKLAKQLIEKAVECGADAIKFQTFKTEEFLTTNSPYFDNFKNVELSYEEFGELNNYSKNLEISFFSAPFDLESAIYLNTLDVPCFKIASSDLTNFPLIKKIANFGKPMIISTGLANMKEIEEVVELCQSQNNEQLILLHSVSNYPTLPDETNLKVIDSLKQKFDYPIGYSDNGDSILVDIASVCMGANMLERHFTLDRKLEGPDHFFSITPTEFKELIQQIRIIEKIKGDGNKKPQDSELQLLKQIRKSLTARRDIQKGQIFTPENIAIKRPEDGIEPKYYDDIIGKKAVVNIKKDTSLKSEFVSE